MFQVMDLIAVLLGWTIIGMVSLFAINFNGGKKILRWIVWEFSGLRFIREKIFPPRTMHTRPPATFIFWLIGAYLALFGWASLKYELRVAKIENRANIVFLQLSSPAYKKALGRIPGLQHISCPPAPLLLKPATVYYSLTRTAKYLQMVNILIETIEDWKKSLDTVELQGAYLPSARLWEANLQEANLKDADLRHAQLWDANLQDAVAWDANFENANLKDADLRGADLRGANLRNANLRNANLQDADLRNACLIMADLRDANLKNADLREAGLSQANLAGAILKNSRLWNADLRQANLQGATYLQPESLAKAQDLYQAQLDLKIKTQVQKISPHLFQGSNR